MQLGIWRASGNDLRKLEMYEWGFLKDAYCDFRKGRLEGHTDRLCVDIGRSHWANRGISIIELFLLGVM